MITAGSVRLVMFQSAMTRENVKIRLCNCNGKKLSSSNSIEFLWSIVYILPLCFAVQHWQSFNAFHDLSFLSHRKRLEL